MKNGTRLRRLVVGEIPVVSAKREARQYRRALEAEVIEAHGEIDTEQAHFVDTASAATAHAAICRWLLRERLATMDTSDVLACSKEVLRAKQSRDSAVKALKLGSRNQVDPWAILDAAHAPQHASDTEADTEPTSPAQPTEGDAGELDDTPESSALLGSVPSTRAAPDTSDPAAPSSNTTERGHGNDD